MGAQTQHKARPQVGRPNATQGTSASWAPQRTSTTQTQGTSARPQVGRPNAMQGTSARWPPKRKTHPQRKRPHKEALGLKTSWRMDKNKFWLGGRLFNMASPRLGTPTQRKARPQRNARHIWKLGAQTQRKASSQGGRPNEKLIRNENVHTRDHLAKRRAGGWIRTNFGLEVDFLIQPHQGRAPQRNARHVRKLGAPMHVRNANARHVRTSASCAPQRNARHVRKMVAQTQNSSTTKTSTQGSTRIKDELEDG
jgi:hypothetical protein